MVVLDARVGRNVTGQVSAGYKRLVAHWADLIADPFGETKSLLSKKKQKPDEETKLPA